MPNYSGSWTLQAQARAQQAGTWPDIVTPVFDETNILIPLCISTYRVTFYRYNWTTATISTVASDQPFYSDNEGIGVVQYPSGNYYFNGGRGSTGANPNFYYLPAGSSTFQSAIYNSGNYSSPDCYSGMTWNPTTSKVNFCNVPLYNEAGSPSAYTMSVSGTTVTSVNTSTFGPYGAEGAMSDVALFISQDKNGRNTLGTSMCAAGYSVKNTGPAKVFKSVTSVVNFNASSGNLGADARSTVAPLSTSTSIITNNGQVFYFDGTSPTNITSSVLSAVWCTNAGNGMYMLINNAGNEAAVYKGAPTITWSATVTTALSLSCRVIIYAWGAGDVFYVVSRSSTASYQCYISKLTFNRNTGAYTVVNRTLTGAVSISSQYFKRWRYYAT
jgi:hypothetical protein